MANNIKTGMRVSTRHDGTGTVIRSNGGSGWVIRFDSNHTSIYYDWEIWSEDGFTHSDNF